MTTISAQMDFDERIQAVSKFLLQSPPGEINDVLNGMRAVESYLCVANFLNRHVDVRNIIADDDSLQQGVKPALREYNIAQFITAEVPGHQHQVSAETSFVFQLLKLYTCRRS